MGPLSDPATFKSTTKRIGKRLLQLQRERRHRLRDSPEWKLQRQIYNQRNREKNDTRVYMQEDYHKHSRHISEMRKNSAAPSCWK